MEKKKRWVWMAAFCFSVLLVKNAAGQGFYIGPQVGYSLQKPSLTDVDFSTDSTLFYGVRAGVKVLMFAIELNYFQAAHNLELEELVTFAWADRQIDYNYLGLNAKVFFPILVLHPYLTAGYGYYHAKIFEIDEDTSKGINLGLGLEVQLGKSFSLLAEGKYHHVNMEIDEEELKIRDFTFCGGFNFYF